MLDSNTVTDVFPPSCGEVGAVEPQPVLIPMPNSNVRVIRKELDDTERVEDQAASMESSMLARTSLSKGALTFERGIIIRTHLSSDFLISQEL